VVSVVISLLHSLCFLVRSRASLHLEIAVLRHQLAVVNRSRRQRVRLTFADRMLWVWLAAMARLARGAPCGSASDCTRLASTRLSFVLDMEESKTHRSTWDAS
jgi:hypothetical protein